MRLLTIFWGCSALSAAERVKLLIQTQDANPKIASVSTDQSSPTFLVTLVCCCPAKRRRDWAPKDHCDGSEIQDTVQYFFLTRDPFNPSPRARFPATLASSTASAAWPRSRASAPSGVATWPTWSVISVSLSSAFALTTCQPLSRLPATPTRWRSTETVSHLVPCSYPGVQLRLQGFLQDHRERLFQTHAHHQSG